MNALAFEMTKRTKIPTPTPKAADATDLARTLWRSAEHTGRRPNLAEVFAITERTRWPDGFVLIDNGRPELGTVIWCGERLACLLRSPKPSRRMADALVPPFQGVLDFLGAASRDDRFVEGCLAIAGSGYFRTYTVMAMLVVGRPALPLIETGSMAALATALVILGRRRRVVAAAVVMVAAVVLTSGAAARWAGLLTDPAFIAGSVLAVAALVIVEVVLATRARTEASLRALERELERAGRIAGVEQFASVVRHEIGQPLSSIAGFLEAARRLLERDGTTATPKAIEHLGLATEQTRRVGDIVRGLQGMFARRPIEPRPSNINALVEQAFAILALDDSNRLPRRVLRLALDLPIVPVDPVPMQQVLVNLGRNAVEGLAGRPSATITVTTRRADDDNVAIDVADNGPGLDPAVADKLFAMSASSKGAGRGIGLAVSRVIVEDHDGTLTASANPSGGHDLHGSPAHHGRGRVTNASCDSRRSGATPCVIPRPAEGQNRGSRGHEPSAQSGSPVRRVRGARE